jgi:spectinomycin phosphotransferase
VHAAPPDLDVALLTATLRDGWSIDGPVTYAPVGNGSHHWRVGDAFVTVDDLGTKPWLGTAYDETFAALRVAYDGAVTLRATLPFVVAPLPSRDGASTARLTDRYAVSVLPWLDGLTPAEGDDAVRAVEALHESDPPPLRTARPEVPRRESLEEALRDLATPWDSGPFGGPARALLTHGADDVRRLLDAYDTLAAEPAGPLVVTHGEPHTGNLLRTRDGGLALVDWDTVALGERERDLWLLPSAGGDRRRRMLYAIRWTLDDAASFVTTLRGPHDDVDAPVLRYLDLTLKTASDQVRDL